MTNFTQFLSKCLIEYETSLTNIDIIIEDLIDFKSTLIILYNGKSNDKILSNIIKYITYYYVIDNKNLTKLHHIKVIKKTSSLYIFPNEIYFYLILGDTHLSKLPDELIFEILSKLDDIESITNFFLTNKYNSNLPKTLLYNKLKPHIPFKKQNVQENTLIQYDNSIIEMDPRFIKLLLNGLKIGWKWLAT